MKVYMLTVVAAAVMSAFAAVMTPKHWQKYIQLVTGVVILSAITSPIVKLLNSDISLKMPDADIRSEVNENLNKNLVLDELTARIEQDIEERVKRDYNSEIKVSVKISVNDRNEIEGVEKIQITEGRIPDVAEQKLCEIYGVDMIYER